MKKTKLLTSIAALALVLGLGACNQPEEETTSEETSEGETTTETEVSTEGAYAIVGDFADSSWNESPDTSSKYFIPAETTHYEVTVTIDDAPTDNEYWTEENQWDAGLSVVEYGTWNRVIAFDELDSNSTGVGEAAGNDNNIVVTWGSTYHLIIDFGETYSIMVKEIEDNTITEMLDAIEEDCNYNATTYYLLEQSNVVSNTQAGRAEAELGIVQAFATDIYATEDAIEIDSLRYVYGDWYYMDIEIYANNYETGKFDYYALDDDATTIYDLVYKDSYDGTWKDTIYSLADLVEYKSAFTVEDSYYGIEEYAVDEDALDTLLNATIGNNYIWNDLFTNGHGWDYYFGFADAADIFSYVTADTSGLLYGEPFLEVAFSDGGGWYYAEVDETGKDYVKDDDGNYLVLCQEVVAYTDIFLDTLGEIDLASMWED